MKKYVLTIAVLLFVLMSGNSYSLNNFNYTGIAFNGTGDILPSQTVGVNIKIIISGTVSYEENHTGVTTDQFGAYTVEVGAGTQVSAGSLGDITAVTKTLRIQATITGGSGGTWVTKTLKPNVAVTGANTSSSGWDLTGNAGTTAGTNFIGTTDNVPFEMRVANGGTIGNQFFIGANNEIYRENPNIGGWVAGNTRGQVAVDLQGYRTNATYVASGNYSTVGGGYDNTASGSQSTVGGGSSNTASGSHSTVGGGYDNTASGSQSTVGGGSSNTASGSLYSTVGGGNSNTASGWFSTVGGGYGNKAIGNNSTVGGGWENTASGSHSTVGGGYGNTASGNYSTIAGGLYAKADKYGQNAYASGRFANNGDAQTSVFVVRNETTDATPTYLYLDGSNQSMTLNDHDGWTFKALVVGRNEDGTIHAAYEITGFIIRRNISVFISGVTTTVISESNTPYNATAVVDFISLAIRVTGDASTTMHWVARVEVAQVHY